MTALVAVGVASVCASWSTGAALGSTPQTITFGALADRTLADPALHVTASSSSGLAVTFTSATPAVCAATGTNGATISPATAGTCTVQANQDGNVTFAAATPVQQSFAVTKGQQTITFGPLADRALSAGAFSVSATSSTGSPVTFTTPTPIVCTATGTRGTLITPVAAGTCTVRADQAGNTIFDAAPPVSQSFTVAKGTQTITFAALADRSVLQSPVTMSAVSSSALPVSFSTTTPAVCAATGTNGATITLVAAGTCTVQADQPGNAMFQPAAPVLRSFTVTRATQSIVFGALAARTTTQSPFTAAATASSGLAVTFTTTTPLVCSATGANGATITLVGAGTCSVQADQAGDAVFNAAATLTRAFAVTKSDQTIVFGSLPDRTAADAPFTAVAAASSTLPVAFSTTTPSVCIAGGANGATITVVAIGSCTVRADQPGDAIYKPAPSATQTFAVTKADQVITFAALADLPIGPPVTVGATASSALPVTFSSATPAVCTATGAAGATITPIAAGTCTVQADQSGNDVYNAAPTVTRSFSVGKSDQTIAFPAPPDIAVTHAPIVVTATATSLLTVTFASTTPAVCTAGGVDGATITVVAAGTCTVRADQAGDGSYNAAPTVTRSFAITKLAQTITFAAPANVGVAHAPITVNASSTALLPVTFSSDTPAVCATGGARGTRVTLLKAGTCRIRADQQGDATFAAAPAVTRSFTVTAPIVTEARSGYWMLGADGRVYPFGAATDFGSSPTPAVAFAARPDGTGYWIVDRSGDVRGFGKAVYHGGRPALVLGESVSTLAATPTGNGYWLFTTTGRVFVYGDAHFYGDMRAVALNGPIVASTATPTGRGYYMVGSDGGVFSFGDARFHGSMGGTHLNRPIVGLSPTPDNHGYWLVASDGGVFAFGAPFRGSLGAHPLNKPVNGLVAYGNGYLMVASDGGVFAFSDKAFVGSLGAHPPAAPIVGIAATPT